MKRLLWVVVLGMVCSGCQSVTRTKFREVVIGKNGQSFTTEFWATSRGDVDRSVHSLYSNGEVATVGQDASGMASPAQLEALKTLQEVVPELAQLLLKLRSDLIP